MGLISLVSRSPSLRTSRPALGRTSGSSLFRIRPAAGYGGRRPLLIAPSPPCRLGPVTPLAVSAASLRARLWAWVALSGLVYARASAAVVVLVLRGTALPVCRGTPRLCAPVCSPFVPPVLLSQSSPWQLWRVPSGVPSLVRPSAPIGPLWAHHPSPSATRLVAPPSPDRCRHPSCHPPPLAWSSCSPWYVWS